VRVAVLLPQFGDVGNEGGHLGSSRMVASGIQWSELASQTGDGP
jgi:hypothetical protein